MTWLDLLGLIVMLLIGFGWGAIWRAKSDRWTEGKK